MRTWWGRRTGVMVVLTWLLATGLTGAVAWRAVAVLGSGTPRTGVLSAQEVAAALASARATATATSAAPTTDPVPSPSAVSAAPSSPAPVPEPGQVARTWPVTGGTVAASCTGSTITLLYATPQDGWSVEVTSSGPDRLKVELTGEDQETTVTAVCAEGVPTQQVRSSAEEHD